MLAWETPFLHQKTLEEKRSFITFAKNLNSIPSYNGLPRTGKDFTSFEKYDEKSRKLSFWDGAKLKTRRREFGFASSKPSMVCKVVEINEAYDS